MESCSEYFKFVIANSMLFIMSIVQGQLTPSFYLFTCPQAEFIILSGVERAVQNEPRLAASLLRLHFHDCFVNGCDASVLLDDTPSFTGEKTAGPNQNSIRGFQVIDQIKSDLESACSGIVSCADILAVAARDSVVSGGPFWQVLLGRRDSITASKTAANNFLPNPASDVSTLISKFQAVGLSEHDMIALSGAHTIGKAKCSSFSQRLFNQSGSGKPDISIESNFLSALQQLCPQSSSSSNANSLAPLDFASPTQFDNQYYVNLLSGRGLLNSDEVLFTTAGSTKDTVQLYGFDQFSFFRNFAASMINMGNISPLTGSSGEIRNNCRFTNSGL
ncbi:hypothetical protein O6H91_01G124200 [Diphasiastrum complanatum]|uniref:Uncharacterized protein n=1 Tax=Diphasiastrum complanatum TaxID=34168 RepID=A0ACC2EVU1_DIPCM|nr:hypothetical protein O6H91_01G124200 [Diphasiastrum complanatum]